MYMFLALSGISPTPLEMYEYLALSVLILSEGVVSEDEFLCTNGNGNGFNGGKIDILRRDNGV